MPSPSIAAKQSNFPRVATRNISRIIPLTCLNVDKNAAAFHGQLLTVIAPDATVIAMKTSTTKTVA